jgi:hypothetical protein
MQPPLLKEMEPYSNKQAETGITIKKQAQASTSVE